MDQPRQLVDDLRARLTGEVLAPGDAGYDEARVVFYGKYDLRPAAIARPVDAAEVARVVALARVAGLTLAVRSGGHSVAGHSATEGGLLLDLAALRALAIDPAARTAWAEAGLTAGAYTHAAGAHGLATPFGDTGSVGLGGLTLGGGIGFLVRKHGLTIDSLLAADIVTADGQLRRVDAEHEPDLFWAIRGGGGNFGVVTRFHYQLHPLAQVVGGLLALPAAPATLADLMAAAEAAPEELSVIANVMAAPPMPFLPAEAHGQLVILALVCYAGAVEAGQRAVDRLRVTTPLADMLAPMPYAALFELFPEGQPGEIKEETARSTFMDKFDRTDAETVLAALRASTAPMAVGQLRVLGGALARVPNDATAFAHRARPFMATVATLYERAEERAEHEAWANALIAALSGGQPGVYVNFLTQEGAARVREAYPAATYARLAAVKARYDPKNVFRVNHNIT